MAGDENLYGGSRGSYGLDSNYPDTSFGPEYKTPSGSLSLATDPRMANQLKEVSAKLNTGTKNIEVTAIQANVFESIPEQHLEELNRLRKLTGSELTLHGPLVEASGITRDGVDEGKRMQVERQMSQVMQRANKLDPNGNVVVTFHTTSGLPEMNVRSMEEVKEGGKTVRKEIFTEMMAINERDGQMVPIKPKINYLLGEENKPLNPMEELKRVNEENWSKQLSHISFQAQNGKNAILGVTNSEGGEAGKGKDTAKLMEEYRNYNTVEGRKAFDKLGPYKDVVERQMQELNYGEIYIRDAYSTLQGLFNQAWESAKKDKSKEDMKMLEEVRNKIAKARAGYIKDKSDMPLFAESVLDGVNALNNLKEPPKLYRPLKDFVVDKSSDTFSSVALNTYNKFKEKSPIISIENPPIGSGLARAGDMAELIEESRRKLTEKLISEAKLSKDDAKKQAERLIGATWDVGHINMMKHQGYNDEEIVKETKKIAKYVNKIHLSDNFGMEHTELPMGMGNVPIKGHMAELKKQYGDKLDKIKKVIETGDWYQHFQTSPFKKTLEAFGSPIYGMEMAPTWNDAKIMNAGYFGGYGMMLPENHFSMYGSGFSNLPTELGGQMAGRSRLSGNPME